MDLIFDHRQSGVVYNFGRFYLSVCLSVCQTIIFESLDVYGVHICTSGGIDPGNRLRVKLLGLYEGHRVKVKVT